MDVVSAIRAALVGNGQFQKGFACLNVFQTASNSASAIRWPALATRNEPRSPFGIGIMCRCQPAQKLLRGNGVVVGAEKILQRRDRAKIGLHVLPAAEQPTIELSPIAQVL